LISSAIGPEVLLLALPISAMRNSKLCGKSMRTRCSSPVTGLRIGWPVMLAMPGTSVRPLRPSMSMWKSIG